MYLLLPQSASIGYLPFLAAYLASVLAGVLSHVPAGLGVLESMLLLLLPDVPPEQLLAAVLMYRVIYEILPLLVALAMWGVYEFVAHDGFGMKLFRNGRARPPDAGGEVSVARRRLQSDDRQQRVSQARPLSKAASTRGAMHQSPQAPAPDSWSTRHGKPSACSTCA